MPLVPTLPGRRASDAKTCAAERACPPPHPHCHAALPTSRQDPATSAPPHPAPPTHPLADRRVCAVPGGVPQGGCPLPPLLVAAAVRKPQAACGGASAAVARPGPRAAGSVEHAPTSSPRRRTCCPCSPWTGPSCAATAASAPPAPARCAPARCCCLLHRWRWQCACAGALGACSLPPRGAAGHSAQQLGSFPPAGPGPQDRL